MTWEPFIQMEGGDHPGWFDFADVYDRAVELAPPGSLLVEVGVFCGKSLTYLGRKARDADKNLRVVGVDTFRGSTEHQSGLSGTSPGALVHDCYGYLADAGLLDFVTLVVTDGERAADLLPDPWFCFIDAEHTLNAVVRDVSVWAPKVKRTGGVLAGHDVDFPGVQLGVETVLGHGYEVMGRSWWQPMKEE